MGIVWTIAKAEQVGGSLKGNDGRQAASAFFSRIRQGSQISPPGGNGLEMKWVLTESQC